MVQINFALKEVNCKVVYYGPGMSGKTTNLEIVHKKAPEQNRGELTSISTDGDRTLFFDYMPLDLGTIAGMRTKFQLYTVPGQVYYNSTRKLVLQGVDGVVFVADSDPNKMKENQESLANLEENLREYGKDLRTLPHVFQWNKRDIPGALPPAELSSQMNRFGAPTFEAVARTGEGVFPTLKALAALVLESLNRRDSGSGRSAPASPLPNNPPAHQPNYSSAPQQPAFSPAASEPHAMPAARPAPKPAMRPAAAAPPAPAHAPATRPVAAASRPAPAAVRPAPVARAATRVATRPTAQHVVRKAAPVAAVVEDDSPSPKSKTGVWVGIALGGLGALAVLGVVFLFLFR
jgi:signal recognition particle receptor subunit beta